MPEPPRNVLAERYVMDLADQLEGARAEAKEAREQVRELQAELGLLRLTNGHLRTMLGKVPQEQLGRIMQAIWAETER